MIQSMAEFMEAVTPKGGDQHFMENYILLPCACNAVEGLHWAKIRKDAAQICDHLAFHTPTMEQLMEMSGYETRLFLEQHSASTAPEKQS